VGREYTQLGHPLKVGPVPAPRLTVAPGGAQRVDEVEVGPLVVPAQRLLTWYTDYDSMPRWSVRDQIVFSRVDATRRYCHLVTMNPDGTGLRQITSGKYSDSHPAWSPDGLAVVFARFHDAAPVGPGTGSEAALPTVPGGTRFHLLTGRLRRSVMLRTCESALSNRSSQERHPAARCTAARHRPVPGGTTHVCVTNRFSTMARGRQP